MMYLLRNQNPNRSSIHPGQFKQLNPSMTTKPISKKAYATIVTEAAQVAGIIILAYSLRKRGSEHALIVLYTPDLLPEAVRALELEASRSQIIMRACEPLLEREHGTAESVDRHGDTWTTLRVFEAFDYDIICYMTSNALIIRNMDSVFDEVDELSSDSIAATARTKDKTSENEQMDCTLFLIRPSEALWSEMSLSFQKTEKTAASKASPEAFLGSFLAQRWHRVPAKYNMPDSLADSNDLGDTICVTFQTEQPWRAKTRNGQDNFRRLWWTEYKDWKEESREKEGSEELNRMLSGHVADHSSPPKPGGPVLWRKVLGEHGHGPRVSPNGSSFMPI
ncbi:Hypothetical protein R9X50_00492400 [Acrodontium crateriforme]|uniref:Nucleotide-diphospho-sugar transferase n=1 Tax=Acrodontium crateriforme TaxID=150365 RepID=A0AAQ3R8R6_9PEZI|nr:Hypothetical protein R9X50_00492400 [Acrodontium crateriforme]